MDTFLGCVEHYAGFNPRRNYTPKEGEVVYALSDRYLPTFESAPKFFRSYERLWGALPRKPSLMCCCAWKGRESYLIISDLTNVADTT